MVHVFHQERTHGRVFRGLEALHHMAHQKRDSHGDHIKMNIPEGMKVADHAGSDANGDVATVYSVVYVTAGNTVPGSSSGFSTDTSHLASATIASDSPPTSSSISMNSDQAAYASAKSAAANPSRSTVVQTTSATVVPVASSTPSSTSATASSSHGDVVVGAPDGPAQATRSSGGVQVGGSGGAVQATRTSEPQKTDSPGTGMSGGAQAGLALGIIAAFAIAAGLLWFCWRRRKTMRTRDGQEPLVDEKHGSFFGSNQATPSEMPGNRFSSNSDNVPASIRSSQTTSTAPRLSLRPVTQFLPNLVGDRKSSGNALDVATTPMAEKQSAWDRRPQNAAENPFADAAILSEKDARPRSTESESKNPFDEPYGTERSRTPSGNHSASNSWEGSEPPTPKSLKVGTASAVAVGKPGPPMPQQPNNVHRVQLDFKPSMDDELELRSGQLVRMLHEYDDGWALCIRMDRSQQGVVPRTCLSKLPVKPRPQGPPNGQRQQGQRRPSNQNGPMYPRPLTPTGTSSGARQRSATADRGQSPNPGGLRRTASDAHKPSGVPVRKPVPGQAL